MSNLNTVISIVPRLKPAIDGVGDYALNLARQLRKDFNIQTRFIVGDPTWHGAEEIEGFPVSKVRDRSPTPLLSLLSGNDDKLPTNAPILLHYVGYGYAKRGCPVWLIDGLQSWKSLYPQRSLVTMFHEISAFGPPWTSAFWLSSLQRNLARKLATVSRSCITSKQSYAELLRQLSRRQQIEIDCLPVFSNIGEPECLHLLERRSRKLVVFGNGKYRRQVYDRCLPSLHKICQMLEIQEIIDIGVPTGLNFKEISIIPILEQGILASSTISEIMQDAIAGFLDFPPPSYLAKSTIFASYCAHGLIPCLVDYSPISIDGLESGQHYWSDGCNLELSLVRGQEIADRANQWYQAHSLSAQSKSFYQRLF
jgi:hypothetical protein